MILFNIHLFRNYHMLLLQHENLDVFMKNRILYVGENFSDVVGVDCCCKVVKEQPIVVSFPPVKFLDQKILNVFKVLRFSLEAWKPVFYV